MYAWEAGKKRVHVFLTILLNQLDRQKAWRRNTTQKQTPTSPDSKRHKNKKGFSNSNKNNPITESLRKRVIACCTGGKINEYNNEEREGEVGVMFLRGSHLGLCVLFDWIDPGVTSKAGHLRLSPEKGGKGIAGATMECVGMLLVRRDVSVSFCLGWLPRWRGVWWMWDWGEGMGNGQRACHHSLYSCPCTRQSSRGYTNQTCRKPGKDRSSGVKQLCMGKQKNGELAWSSHLYPAPLSSECTEAASIEGHWEADIRYSLLTQFFRLSGIRPVETHVSKISYTKKPPPHKKLAWVEEGS